MPGAARLGYITGALAPAAFGWAWQARLVPVVFGWARHCVARSGNPTAAETSPKLSESGAVRQGMVMRGWVWPGEAWQGKHTGAGAPPKLSRLGVSGQTPAGPSSAAHGPAWQGKAKQGLAGHGVAAITGRFSPRSFSVAQGVVGSCSLGPCVVRCGAAVRGPASAWRSLAWLGNHHGQETAQSFCKVRIGEAGRTSARLGLALLGVASFMADQARQSFWFGGDRQGYARRCVALHGLIRHGLLVLGAVRHGTARQHSRPVNPGRSFHPEDGITSDKRNGDGRRKSTTVSTPGA